MGCKITKTTDKDSYNPQGGSGISSTISSSPSSFSNIKDNNQTTSSSFVYSKDLNTKAKKTGHTTSSNKYVVTTTVHNDTNSNENIFTFQIQEALVNGANLIGLNLKFDKDSIHKSKNFDVYNVVEDKEVINKIFFQYFLNDATEDPMKTFQDNEVLGNFLSSCTILSNNLKHHEIICNIVLKNIKCENINMMESKYSVYHKILIWMKNTFDAINTCNENNNTNITNYFKKSIVKSGLLNEIIQNMFLLAYQIFGKSFDSHPGSMKANANEYENKNTSATITIVPEMCHETMSAMLHSQLAKVFNNNDNANSNEKLNNNNNNTTHMIENLGDNQNMTVNGSTTIVLNKIDDNNVGLPGWTKPPLAINNSINSGNSNNNLDGDVPPLQLSNLIDSRKTSMSAEDQFTISGRFTPLQTISYRGTFSTRSSRRQQQLRQQLSNSNSNRSLMNKSPTPLISPLNPTPSSPGAIAATSRSSNTQNSNNSDLQQDPIMPALRLPLFRVENAIQESVRTPFTPSRRGRYLYNDNVVGSHNRTSRGNLKTFGDPKNLLKDMAIKAGELCVAKDLWALVARRRRIREDDEIAVDQKQSIKRVNESRLVENGESALNLMDSKRYNLWLLLLEYLFLFKSFFNINDKNILIDTNSKVTKLLFHIIVAMNKDTALKNETVMLTEFNELFYKLSSYNRTNNDSNNNNVNNNNSNFESHIHSRARIIRVASTRFCYDLQKINADASQNVLRSLKSLGFEQVLTMSILNQYCTLSSKQNGDGLRQSLNGMTKQLLIEWRDSCSNIYRTLAFAYNQSQPSNTGRAVIAMNLWIRDILSHKHANSCGSLISIINTLIKTFAGGNSMEKNNNSMNMKMWFIENFVMNESFLSMTTLYLELLLQFSLPSIFQSNVIKLLNLKSSNIETNNKEQNSYNTFITLYKGSILGVLSYFSKCANILNKCNGLFDEEKQNVLLNVKQCISQIFDPNCSIAQDWLDNLSATTTSSFASKSSNLHNFSAITTSLLNLKASIITMCSTNNYDIMNKQIGSDKQNSMLLSNNNYFLLYRSLVEDSISFHYMAFMKLYNSTDFTMNNIQLCVNHLQILFNYVISSVNQSRLHVFRGHTRKNVGDEDSIMQWNDVTSLFFQLRFVNFFLKELSLESNCLENIAGQDSYQKPEEGQKIDMKSPINNIGALKLKLPTKFDIGLHEGDSNAMDDSYAENNDTDVFNSSWDSEDSYGDLPVENDFSNSTTPSLGFNLKPLLSISMASNANDATNMVVSDDLGITGNSKIPTLSIGEINDTPSTTTMKPSFSLKIPLSITKGGGDNNNNIINTEENNDDDNHNVFNNNNSFHNKKEFIEKRRNAIKLYHSDELHVLILQMLIRLSIQCEGGSLDPRYCPRLPALNEGGDDNNNVTNLFDNSNRNNDSSRKLNLPYILHHHLNDPFNSKIIKSLYEHACDFKVVGGKGPKRLVQLLCCEILNNKSKNFGSPLNFGNSLISSGAFGTVHKNTYYDASSDTMTKVAVKCVPLPKTQYNRSYIVDIYSEVTALEILSNDNNHSSNNNRSINNSNNFVEILDFGVSQTAGYCIVMKCYSKTLKQWRVKMKKEEEKKEVKMKTDVAKQQQIINKRKLLEKCLNYFETIVLSIYDMHKKGICHYDLKCDNILLNDDSTIIKIVDFGEAHVRPGWHGQNMYSTMDRGTECIKSPEMLTVCHADNKESDQYDRRRKVGTNAQSDIWSLGCLLYEMLVGEYLFQDEDWTRFYCRLTGRGEQLLPDNARLELLKFGSYGRELLEFLQTSMLVRNPSRRISSKELLRHIRKFRKKLMKEGIKDGY